MTGAELEAELIGAELAEAEAECDELEEMLTAATDVAVQRGKRIEELERELTEAKADASYYASYLGGG